MMKVITTIQALATEIQAAKHAQKRLTCSDNGLFT